MPFAKSEQAPSGSLAAHYIIFFSAAFSRVSTSIVSAPSTFFTARSASVFGCKLLPVPVLLPEAGCLLPSQVFLLLTDLPVSVQKHLPDPVYLSVPGSVSVQSFTDTGCLGNCRRIICQNRNRRSSADSAERIPSPAFGPIPLTPNSNLNTLRSSLVAKAV